MASNRFAMGLKSALLGFLLGYLLASAQLAPRRSAQRDDTLTVLRSLIHAAQNAARMGTDNDETAG